MINTNNATKGKSNESSKIKQIGIYQTSSVKDEETDYDNIPLNKLYKHCHSAIKKKTIKETKTQAYVMKLFITSHNKNQ